MVRELVHHTIKWNHIFGKPAAVKYWAIIRSIESDNSGVQSVTAPRIPYYFRISDGDCFVFGRFPV